MEKNKPDLPEFYEQVLHNIHLLEYASYAEFLQDMATGKPKEYLTDVVSRKTSKEGYSFTGTKDFAEALNLARSGWPEGLANLQKINATLNTDLPPLHRRRTYVRDVVGCIPEVASAARGEPEHWFDFRQENSSKVFGLAFCGGYSASVTPKTLYYLTTGVIYLIKHLEATGRSVVLDWILCVNTRHTPSTTCITIPIKQLGHYLDIDRLVFAICHRAFFRRLMFSCMEVHPYTQDQYHHQHTLRSYGYCLPLSVQRTTLDLLRPKRYHLAVFPDRNLSSVQEGIELLKAQAREQNITLDLQLSH